MNRSYSSRGCALRSLTVKRNDRRKKRDKRTSESLAWARRIGVVSIFGEVSYHLVFSLNY